MRNFFSRLVFPRVGYVLTLSVLLGIASTSYLSFTVWDYLRNLNLSNREQQAFFAFQLEIEYLKLIIAISDIEASKTEDLSDLRKRFDILYSRIDPLKKISGGDAENAKIQILLNTLDAQIPLIDGPDSRLRANLDQIKRDLVEIEYLPREVALKYVATGARSEDMDREKNLHVLEMMIAVVFVVTGALGFVVVRLSRQTWSLNEATLKADENGQRLSATLRGSLDGIIVTNGDATITDFSASAEEVFGFTRDEAVGQNFVELLVPPERRQLYYDALETFHNTGKAAIAGAGRHEVLMLNNEGEVFHAEMMASIAQTRSGPIFISYISDITDKKNKDAELIRWRDEAVLANKERSRFFAMMSHEMRTPLNGVLSGLQMLQGSTLDKAQQSYLNAALTSGDILLGHINDVLAIERAEDQAPQEPVPCDLGALISDLIDTMNPLAQGTQTRLHLDLGPLPGKFFLTEPKAIQQIVVNLLSNAIKFTPGGDVHVHAQYAPETDKGILRLEIRDNGIGIAKDDLARIFEDFVSLDSSYERRTGGTGLGLGIVRRFVGQLGGDISCTSDIGVGSSFVLRIPTEEVAQPDIEELETGPALSEPVTRQSLLIVDDNDINRELLGAMVERLGHSAQFASGGQKAIDMALLHHFDTILMDISMPEISGTQATRAIRAATGPNKNTRIVAVTAHAMPHEREAFKAAGMNGFLSKPINLRALGTCLADAPVRRIEPDSTDEPPLLDRAQIEELKEMLGPDSLVERAHAYRTQTQSELAAITQTTDIREIQKLAHAMAGASGMMGAAQLYQLLQKIETACKLEDHATADRLVRALPGVAAATFTAWEQFCSDCTS